MGNNYVFSINVDERVVRWYGVRGVTTTEASPHLSSLTRELRRTDREQ